MIGLLDDLKHFRSGRLGELWEVIVKARPRISGNSPTSGVPISQSRGPRERLLSLCWCLSRGKCSDDEKCEGKELGGCRDVNLFIGDGGSGADEGETFPPPIP